MSPINTTYDNRTLGKSGGQFDAVFTDKKDNSTLSQSDFLNLMVAQMQNQDFMNPMDNTQMVEQMVMFSNMQQMQEMTAYSKSNYAMSLIGKTVTASRFTVSGDLDTVTGPVQKVSLVDKEYVIYVGGKKYTMGQIMGVQDGKNSGQCAVDATGYKITASELKPNSATVKWEIPTEDKETAAQLKYTVYYSAEGPFDTLEKVEAGTKSGTIDGKKDATTHMLVDLKPDTTYYVGVVVTDVNGNKSLYKPTTIKTKTE